LEDRDLVYIIRSRPAITAGEQLPAGANAATIDADSQGRVLFREPVRADVFESGLAKCLGIAKKTMDAASNIAAEYRVETITLKLSIDAEVGCVFVGDAKLEAGIEIEIKRRS